MNCSIPGFFIHYYLLGFPQTHVHWISDAIQPSHPLSPPCPLALIFSSSSHQLILEPKKINSDTVSTFSPSVCHEVIGLDGIILVFWMLSFKPAFSLSSFTFIKRFFSSSSLLPLKWYHLHIKGCCYFPRQSWLQLVIHLAQHFTWCTLHIS